MATAYLKTAEGGVKTLELTKIADLPSETIWLDLLEPSREDERLVESFLGIDVPTEQEIEEIEDSSRFYQKNNSIYLTVSLLTRFEAGQPTAADIRFILTPHRLISVRYGESKPFRIFSSRILRDREASESSDIMMERMLELVVDDLADILEETALKLDKLARKVFFSSLPGKAPESDAESMDLKEMITEIGRYGEFISEARLSVFNMNRLLIFLSQTSVKWWQADTRARLQTLLRDIRSLTEHATFIANRVNFILDATLGMINIEQNKIIKIFSVAAVVFLPPTLIASIYGMNFHFMPELHWAYGYPVSIALMIMAAVLPYWYFKRRGWL
jgi:magnesium transporter